MSDEASDGGNAFPWGPVQVVAVFILSHFAIVFALVGTSPVTERLSALGGLVAGEVAEQPWRLLTSLFIHADPAHVFWNGISMLVFAVPVVLEIGYLRAAAVYLAGGVLGGLAGASVLPDGVVLFGSSGAVAALFGAWVGITFMRARHAGLRRRARVRVVGVAMLILPLFLTPVDSSGRAISVAAHMGGLAAGVAAGLAWGTRYGPEADEAEGQGAESASRGE